MSRYSSKRYAPPIDTELGRKSEMSLLPNFADSNLSLAEAPNYGSHSPVIALIFLRAEITLNLW